MPFSPWAGYRTLRATSTASPAKSWLARRTSFLTGSTNEPRALSGNTDVSQVEQPSVTVTGMDPKPGPAGGAASRSSSMTAAGKVRKCQPPTPSCAHTDEVNRNSVDTGGTLQSPTDTRVARPVGHCDVRRSSAATVGHRQVAAATGVLSVRRGRVAGPPERLAVTARTVGASTERTAPSRSGAWPNRRRTVYPKCLTARPSAPMLPALADRLLRARSRTPDSARPQAGAIIDWFVRPSRSRWCGPVDLGRVRS